MNTSKTLLTAAVVATLSTLPILSIAASTPAPAPAPTSQATNNCCHAKKSKNASATTHKAPAKKTNPVTATN